MLLDVGGAGHGFVANAATSILTWLVRSGRVTCGARGVRLAVDRPRKPSATNAATHIEAEMRANQCRPWSVDRARPQVLPAPTPSTRAATPETESARRALSRELRLGWSVSDSSP
jgi:hypothetical protein